MYNNLQYILVYAAHSYLLILLMRGGGGGGAAWSEKKGKKYNKTKKADLTDVGFSCIKFRQMQGRILKLQPGDPIKQVATFFFHSLFVQV